MGEGTLIFVTVGTGNTYGFDRLIKKMDEIAGRTNEEVMMQIGCTEYEPLNAKYYRFIDKNDIEEFYYNSKIIVCHSGIGSILTAMKFNKPTIIVPRRKNYNEHIDDHQIEIAEKLEKENGLIKVVWDIEKLDFIIQNPSTFRMINGISDGMLAAKIKYYLNEG